MASFEFDLIPTVTLHGSALLSGAATAGFAATNTPLITMYNKVYLNVFDDVSGVQLMNNGEEQGFDKLYGYTSDVNIVPSKSATQTQSDVDYNARTVTIHYTATVQERSVIGLLQTYNQALADGSIQKETSGIWYDLLPKGMTPIISTVRLRSNDSIKDVYTIENFRNSGRTLLVVEADLKNQPERYTSEGIPYYMDAPQLKFDAIYGFDSIIDYGDVVHNVVAFQSGNASMGSVSGYLGEPDDPTAGNNSLTASAFANAEEQAIMTNLDPVADNPNFAYAGVSTTLNILSAARTSLSKDVQVNNDGIWTMGTYGDDAKVYEGGLYSYRLRMMSDDETISKDMILYDAIEQYVPGASSDPDDVGSATWHGRLVSVDVSQLEALGCAPVVYYSTVVDRAAIEAGTGTDVSDATKWILASNYSGSMSSVTAVAVDASKCADSSDFELQPLQSAVVLINMRAPDNTQVNIDTLSSNNAAAFNDSYMLCTSIDARSGAADYDNMVHKEYTKVGIQPYNLSVSVNWADGQNRDGIRPASTVVHVLKDGVDMGVQGTLSENNDWQLQINHVPYAADDGTKYHYSVTENPIEGYSIEVQRDEVVFSITNRHDPERITLTGEKLWVGDEGFESSRPQSITVFLRKDGSNTNITSARVTPNEEGKWIITFSNQYKYENGSEIQYCFAENTADAALHDYIATVSQDGFTITNTYHPYGNLLVTKMTQNATTAAGSATFGINFEFTTEDGDQNTVPVFEIFDYDVLDGSDNILSTGTLSTNSTVTIHAGETIKVKEIPAGVHYAVTENDTPGFTLTSATNRVGTIQANRDSNCGLVNTYASSGSYQLICGKTLSGRTIKNYQFRFELYDMQKDSVIRVAFSGSPTGSETVGGVLQSSAEINFGNLRFNETDDGETYRYRISEVDLGVSGYEYDDNVYYVDITVADQGDGTLRLTPAFYNANNVALADVPTFENEYAATGSITLKSWKMIKGRTLQNAEFSFQLIDENGNVLQTKTNDADGNINWDTLNFTQADADKTISYTVREVFGSDSTVVYDSSEFVYEVTVEDLGNGTLSTSQSVSKRGASAVEDEHGDKEYTNVFSSHYGLTNDPDGFGAYIWSYPAETTSEEVLERYMLDGVEGMNNPTLNETVRTFANFMISHGVFEDRSFHSWDTLIPGNGIVVSYIGPDTLKSLFEGISASGIYTDNGTSSVEGDLYEYRMEIRIRNTSQYGEYDTDWVLTRAPLLLETISYSAMPLFINTLKPGELAIEKYTYNSSNQAYDTDEVFTFRLEVDAESLPEDFHFEVVPATPPAFAEPAPAPDP